MHTQKDLPNNLKDNTIIEMHRNKRAMFMEKRSEIIKTFVFDKEGENILLFIVCGRDIQHNLITPGKVSNFIPLNFQVDADTEICEILNTSDPELYQFVIRDEDKSIIVVVTWNIITDCEKSMF